MSFKSDSGFPSEELRVALLGHPAVHEAAVLMRRDTQGADCAVAYIVPADVRSIPTLPADMGNRLPPEQLPDGYVFVSSLPLDEYGRVAADELQRHAVIDEDLIDRWKRTLNGIDGVHQVEILSTERTPAVGSLHRTELLPVSGAPVRRGGEAAAPDSRPPAADKDRRKGESRAVPALVHGEALVETPDDPQTLGEALRRAAERHSEHGIVHIRPDGTKTLQSYPQLLDQAGQMLAGLAALGLRPGDKVILQLADGREFLTAFWACVLGGMVPAPFSIAPSYVASNATVQRLFNAWQLLDRPLILAGDEIASGLRSVLGLAGAEADRVQTIAALPKADLVPPHEPQPDDLTLILFTSGSTGVPKGVMQSHRSLLCMARGTAQQNGFSARDITLNWMPLEHVGAISFLHTLPTALGCRQIHVPTEYILQDPLRWLDLMEQFGVSISWGPNFAFNLVNERVQDLQRRQRNLSSMRFLVSAGELIVSNTTQRFLDLLAPHGLMPAALRPAFGMSETCSGITWSQGYRRDANDAIGPFVDLGPPIPSASLRIADDQGRILNEGEIGRLQLKGPSVTTGYYKNPEANSKVFTRDGWFDTGDLGFIREGRLTLTGREKDEIIINGINYVAAEIEAVVDTAEGVEVSYSAACAVRAGGSDSEELAIFFSPSSRAEGRLGEVLRSIRERVASELGIRPAYLVPLARHDIPKTAIGKIQHAQLRRRFAEGEFQASLKSVDLLAGINTIPDWFFRKVWRRKAPCAGPAPAEPAGTLVFADRHGLGEELCRRLTGSGRACIVVEAGADFERSGADRYRIDPKDRDHYRRLTRSLRDEGRRIDRIAHLWTYDRFSAPAQSIDELAQAQHLGTYSILHLVQALAEAPGDKPRLELYVAGCGTQTISSVDTGNGRHGTILGLLKTVPLELSWIRCRHIDLDFDAAEANAQRLDEEMQAVGDDEVAYRAGNRLVWRLEQVDLGHTETCELPIRQSGTYLISGGLGGIGARLARLLIRDYRARLILIGTTRLPDRSEWPKVLASGGKPAARIQAFMDLESLGGEFVYEAVDVADAAGLRDIVAAAESRWDAPLAGVFHLAAGGDVGAQWQALDRHTILNETPRSFEQMFRPSVYGVWALYEVIRERPDALLVAFSSAIHLFGGANFSAYASSHSYLQTFVAGARQHHPHSYCFSWSVWEDIGRSKAEPAFVKDLYRANGYALISPEAGMDCLVVGLLRDQPDLIVGLDGGNPNIRRYMTGDASPIQGLTAFFTLSEGAAVNDAHLKGLTIRDRFGTPSRCEFRPLPEMPLTPTGDIARDVLLRGAHGGEPRGAGPGTAVEQKIAAIWREVLKINRVGLHDSFFASGGNSLSATQVISRIGLEFQVRLDVRDLFEHGTVHKLAALVAHRQSGRPDALVEEEAQELDIEALSMDVDGMSDDEVAALLGELQGRTKVDA